ncbi:hypothetical protein BDV18DRAFT_162225 [Aspergillus unguis]
MHLNLAFLLSISSALAVPFAPKATTQVEMADMKAMNNMKDMQAVDPMSIEPIEPMRITMPISTKMIPMAPMYNNPNNSTNATLPIGNAVVINHCASPIYLWSVGQSISPQYILPPGWAYAEYFRRDPQTGGIAIKITAVKHGLYTSAPQTVFAYNLVENAVWYDLSDVFGDPFEGETVTVEGSEPAIHWEEGVPPRGSQVRIQRADMNLVLDVCAE